MRRDAVSLRLLLAAGADANSHRYGVALVQAAAALGFVEGVRALLSAGAVAEARSSFEEQMWRLADSRGRDAILLQLVGNGAHLHLLSRNERDAVADAVGNGDGERLAGLLANADRRWDALRGAIVAGDMTATRRLLAPGAGIMRGHGEGELIVAIEHNQPRIVEWLLAIGADPTAQAHPDAVRWLKTNDDELPEWGVTDRGSVFGRVPYQYDAEVSPAMLAFNTGPLGVVDMVLNSVEPNDRNLTDPEHSYLDEAFRGYLRHRDQRILERARTLGGAPALIGPQADEFLGDICRWTGDDAPTVMRAYLEMGYRPRAAGSPAHSSAYPGDDPALSNCIVASAPAAIMLLEYGADPNQLNSIDTSALWEALEQLNSPGESVQLLERLLAAGGDPNSQSGERSPLQYAVTRSRTASPAQAPRFGEAAQLLLNHGARTSERVATAHERPLLPIR